MATASPSVDSQPSSTFNAETRWLHGPVLDIAIGCGGLYAWILLLYAINAPALHRLQPTYLIALMMLLISMPHYGGTLVRVYEQRSERKKYFLFSVVSSVLIFAIFFAGLQNALIGSWFFTVYLTWSPWHYTGQNYGLAVMFLRRRGIRFDDTTKRILYLSFMLSFALTFLLWHTASAHAPPRGENTGTVTFLPLGIPEAVNAVAIPGVALAYLVTLVWAGTRLLRTTTAKELLPVACLSATQALWFSIPFFIAQSRITTGIAPLDNYFDLRIFTIWTVMGHASQYLWVTSYYAKASPNWRGPVQYYGKAAASGIAIWTLPAILFSVDAFGTYSYNGGLALMIAAAVNIHHFVLDGAIWKLRNTKIASVLIRSVPEETVSRLDENAAVKPLGRWLVWGLTIAVALSAYFVFWQKNFVLQRSLQEGSLARYEAGLDRMAWLGRDSEEGRIRLGEAYAAQDSLTESEAQFRRSLALQPSMVAFNGLMSTQWKQGDFRGVVLTCEDALEHYPEEARILVTQSEAWLELDQPIEARKALERALAITPDSETIRARLERL